MSTSPTVIRDTDAAVLAWQSFAMSWLGYLDNLRHGLDAEPFQYAADTSDLAYLRSHLATFLHSMARARTPEERAAVINEARIFLGKQEPRARLEPSAPMKMTREMERLKLTR